MRFPQMAVWAPTLFCGVLITLSSSNGYAQEDATTDRIIPGLERLIQLCDPETEPMADPTVEELDERRTILRRAAERLNDTLDRGDDPRNSVRWREYVYLNDLAEQLDAPRGTDEEATDEEFALLQRSYVRLSSGEDGLHWQAFRNLRDALRQYMTTTRYIESPESVQRQYAGLMGSLPEAIREYEEEPTTEQATRISLALRWLEDVGRGQTLRDAVLERYTQPNLYLDVSSQLIADALYQKREGDPTDLSDVILGTRITGEGLTDFEMQATTVRNVEGAEIGLLFHTEITGPTVGRNGPATVCSDTFTTIEGRLPFWIDSEEIRIGRVEADARTTADITAVCVDGRKLMERIVHKRIGTQKAESLLVGALHAEQRFARQVQDEAGAMLIPLNELYTEEIREPLQHNNLFPELLDWSSTEEDIQLVGRKAIGVEFGAESEPPELVGEPDVAIRVHESMINNLLSARLAGAVLRSEDFETEENAWQALFGLSPEKIAEIAASLGGEVESDAVASDEATDEPIEDPNAKPWSIYFAREMPVTVEFDDDCIRITVRGREFEESGRTHVGMNITVTYRIEAAGPIYSLVLAEEPEVLPPGFNAEAGDGLSTGEVAIQTIIKRRLSESLPVETTIIAHTPFQQDRGLLSGIRMTDFSVQDRWLTATWEGVRNENTEVTISGRSDKTPDDVENDYEIRPLPKARMLIEPERLIPREARNNRSFSLMEIFTR
jgi:hypothetical protein